MQTMPVSIACDQITQFAEKSPAGEWIYMTTTGYLRSKPGAIPRFGGFMSWLILGLLAVMWCFPDGAWAQTAGSKAQTQSQAASGKSKGKSKPVISDRPQVLGTVSVTTTSNPDKPLPPTSATSAEPPEVTLLVQRFQSAREAYLETQKELRLKMQNSTEEERELLREKLGEALATWKEEHKQFVEEQKERIKQMKQELHPDLVRVVDAAGDDAGGRRGR